MPLPSCVKPILLNNGLVVMDTPPPAVIVINFVTLSKVNVADIPSTINLLFIVLISVYIV